MHRVVRDVNVRLTLTFAISRKDLVAPRTSRAPTELGSKGREEFEQELHEAESEAGLESEDEMEMDLKDESGSQKYEGELEGEGEAEMEIANHEMT
jgi:hypothetical protein